MAGQEIGERGDFLKEKKVLVIGLARSGAAVARKLAKMGAEVVVSDNDRSPELELRLAELKDMGIRGILGGHPLSLLEEVDLVIVSPGVPTDIAILQEAERRGIPVWSEIELAYRLIPAPIVGITGTNGKTTTTSLIDFILDGAGRPHLAAGNIGRPLLECIDLVDKNWWIIAEVSSFQLERTHLFRPRIGVLLNITSDHLDRHGDMEEYIKLKFRLFANQIKEDYAVLNVDDPNVSRNLRRVCSRLIPISLQRCAEGGVFVREGHIVSSIEEEVDLMPVEDVPLYGLHNLTNVMSAVAVSLLLGVPPEVVKRSIKEFRGLDHRMELVGDFDGILVFNDSKATNPDATIRALESFKNKVVLIAGGRDKRMDFHPLAEAIVQRVKRLVLLGEAAEKIARMVAEIVRGKELEKEIYIEKGIFEAVERAFEGASQGDVILLSPACASFDMFRNYEERGDLFKKAVRTRGKPDG